MGYVWAVWKNNRLAGYVESSSSIEALRIAQEKYGRDIYVIREPSVSPC
jgi:hypothetical protein